MVARPRGPLEERLESSALEIAAGKWQRPGQTRPTALAFP